MRRPALSGAWLTGVLVVGLVSLWWGFRPPSCAAKTYQVLAGGMTTPGTGTTYGAVDTFIYNSGTENQRRSLAGASGTLTGLKVNLTSAPGVSASRSFTVRVNAANTALSCSISGSNTTCTDADVVSVTAGDELTMTMTVFGTPTESNVASYYLYFIGTTHNESTHGGGSGDTNLSASATRYVPLLNVQFPSASEDDQVNIIPVAGTLKNFYADLSGSPDLGAGTQSYVFTVRQCTPTCADTAVACTISETATTCNDTTDALTVSAGDLVSVSVVPSGTPTARTVAVGMGFIPTTEGDFMLSMTDDGGSLSTTVTEYTAVTTGDENWNATEADVRQIVLPFTVRAYYVRLTPAPDTGAGVQSYAFTLQDDAGATGQTCTVADLATTCNLTTSEDAIADSSLLDHKSVPSASAPAATQTTIGISGFLHARRTVRLD